MSVDVRSTSSDELTSDTLQEIHDLLLVGFEGDFSDEDWGHTVGGRHFFVKERGSIVSHASVVPRIVEAGPRRLRTGYVEGVVTHPARRGQGLGSAAMSEASAHIRSDYEMGALAPTCSASTSAWAGSDGAGSRSFGARAASSTRETKTDTSWFCLRDHPPTPRDRTTIGLAVYYILRNSASSVALRWASRQRGGESVFGGSRNCYRFPSTSSLVSIPSTSSRAATVSMALPCRRRSVHLFAPSAL